MGEQSDPSENLELLHCTVQPVWPLQNKMYLIYQENTLKTCEKMRTLHHSIINPFGWTLMPQKIFNNSTSEPVDACSVIKYKWP